jgi:hypothetical protein
MEVKELAKAEGFGDLICLYPFHKTSGLSLLILSLIIIPIAVLMLLTGIALAIGVSEFGLVAGILGVVLAFFGLAAICFIPYRFKQTSLMSATHGVHFYERGLITLQGLRIIAVQYSDIEVLRTKLISYQKVNYRGSYQSMGATCTYTIRTTQGKRVVFNNNAYQDILQLGSFLADKFVQYKFPEAFKQYSSGEAVEFGKISVHPDYLKVGRKALEWDTIKTIKVKNGCLLIMQEEEEWMAHRIKVAEIPNFSLLTELLKSISNSPFSTGW